MTNCVIVNSDIKVIIKINVPVLVQERLAKICMILVNVLALREVFFIDYIFIGFLNLSHCSE